MLSNLLCRCPSGMRFHAVNCPQWEPPHQPTEARTVHDPDYPEGWRNRLAQQLKEADDRIGAAQRAWPSGPVFARLEIARENLAHAARLIDKGL